MPNVDTVLMLRPTESPTLFLQQLGRGLRKTQGKAVCTVLDFVGTHRTRVPLRPPLPRPARRHPTGRRARRAAGIPLPAGRLPHAARPQGIRDRATQPARRDPVAVASEGRGTAFATARPCRDLGLSEFLRSRGSTSTDVYDGITSWSDLCRPPACRALRRDRTRGRFAARSGGFFTSTTGADRRLPTASRRSREAPDVGVVARARSPAAAHARRRPGRSGHHEGTRHSRRRSTWSGHTRRFAPSSPSSRRARPRVDHLHAPLATHPTSPLQVHARYTRIEILAALGLGDGAKGLAWQSGVYGRQGRQRGPARLHPRQEQRRLLADDPLPRLRDQPSADPLGEPVLHPRGQRHGSALPAPRTRGPLDPAVRPAPHQ